MISPRALQKEEVLVLEYQATNCNKAFGALYEMFYTQLFDYICKITNNTDDAFDITQEAFIQAAQKLHTLKVPITFRFWLFRIAKNMCMKNYRKVAKLAYENYEDDIISQDYSVNGAIEKEDLLDRMDEILSALSEDEKSLLLSKYSDGKSIKQLMVENNLGSSAIKMKLMRARTKVAKQLCV